MAATLAPDSAFDFAKTMIKKMPLQDIKIRVLDSINKIIWMAAPWRWTIGSLTALNLAASTQDYAITLPADFLYAVRSYITDGAKPTRELSIESALPTAVVLVGQPTRISFTGAGGSGNARVSPKVPADHPASPTQQIITLYKKTSPLITSGNAATGGVLVMDDEWWWVYEAGVLWLAYLYADDARAGGAQVDPMSGRVQYTGQRGTFEGALIQMKEREKLWLVDPKSAQEPKATEV